MQRVSENYRKLRNTLRFLLSNLSDFSPPQHALHFSQLQPLDQYILARTAELDAAIRTAYDEFEFHRAYQALNEFINTDLSALYLDVVKDRLYTLAPDSPARRSAQTALWRIAEALTRLIAPILSFTADEVWQYLPHSKAANPACTSHSFPTSPTSSPVASPGSKRIGRSFCASASSSTSSSRHCAPTSPSAKVSTLPSPHRHRRLRRRHDPPPLRGRAARVPQRLAGQQCKSVGATQNSSALLIKAEVAAGSKCERCWRVVPDVGSDARWPSVCSRCAEALDAINFPPTQEAA